MSDAEETGGTVTTEPLVEPPVMAVSADIVASGPPVPAIQRLRLLSADDWEDFVAEWAVSLDEHYENVVRCGSGGDMGRDVIAYPDADESTWDNYQCKRYGHPLWPSNVWVEFGKLVYYTHLGKYTWPRRYYFVAPKGAGTTLMDMLKDATGLRRQVIEKWEKHCESLNRTRFPGQEGGLIMPPCG